MAPRRRGDPLGHLALDHEHEALRPRLIAQHVVQDGAGDVVRHVGHEGPGAAGHARDLDVQEVGRQQRAAAARPRTARAGARRGGRRARPRSRRAPAPSSAAVRTPRPGPTSTMRSPRLHVCHGHDALQHVAVGEVVLRERARARPARGGAGSAPPLPGRGAARRVRAAAPASVPQPPASARGARPASASARSPATKRRQPAAPIIAAVVRAQARPWHDERDAQAAGALGDALAQDAVGGHAAAHDDAARTQRARPPAGSCVASTSTTDSWKAQASSATSAGARREPSSSRSSGERPSASPTARRTAVLRPLKREVERVAQPRPREAPVVRAWRVAAAAMMAGPPG